MLGKNDIVLPAASWDVHITHLRKLCYRGACRPSDSLHAKMCIGTQQRPAAGAEVLQVSRSQLSELCAHVWETPMWAVLPQVYAGSKDLAEAFDTSVHA